MVSVNISANIMEDCELESRFQAWTLDSSFINHLKNLSSLPEHFLPSPENERSYSTVICIKANLVSQATMGSSLHLLVKTHRDPSHDGNE